jgi:hypothetical protein
VSKPKGPPDEWVEDGWDNFTPEAREWYYRYSKATTYGNFDVLRELCEEAPTDQYERIKEEIIYERNSYQRGQYTIPKSNFPSYSEWDYSWSAPPPRCPKTEVVSDYYGEESNAEMYSPTKRKKKSKNV